MKIQSSHTAPTMAAYKTAEKAFAQSSTAAATGSAADRYSGERAKLASEIMTGQDLTNISRNELKTLVDKLYNAGVITGEQRLDMTAPYVDQLNTQMQSVFNPDEKRNYLSDLAATLNAAKRLRPDDASSIAHLQKVNHLADSLFAVSDKA